MDESKLKELKEAIRKLDDIIETIEKAPTHEEKVKAIKNFPSLPGMEIDKLVVNGKQLEEYDDYQKAKKIVFGFLGWLEKEGVNVFDALQQRDDFFVKVRSTKLFEIAVLIGSLNQVDFAIQPYLLLNTYRTIYEVNHKILTLLVEEYDKKKGTPPLKEYFWSHIKQRFCSGDFFDELSEYFDNDLRNPIAHEEWLVKDDKIFLRWKGDIKEVEFKEIAQKVYQLFFLIAVLQLYLYKGYEIFASNKQVTPQVISIILSGLKKQRAELEKYINPSRP